MCYTRVKHHLNASTVERIHHTGKYCDERYGTRREPIFMNFIKCSLVHVEFYKVIKLHA